jgi:hypothetical protein
MEWIGAFVVKNFDGTSFSENVHLWHQFIRFCADLLAVTKRFETPPKHEFWVQWTGSGAFVVKNSDTTSFCEVVG